MIVGLQDFITFDGRHIEFIGSCTYLLARDFVHDTFAILLEYQQQSDRVTHKIIVLLGKDALELNFFNDVSKNNNNNNKKNSNN